jgi:hypothetical protein
VHLVGFHYKEYQDARSAKHKICWLSYRVMTIYDDFHYYVCVFIDQNQSTFVLPRMSSSPTKNITFPAHLLRQRKLALMTWMIVMSHGYKFSMENELAWVSISSKLENVPLTVLYQICY